MAIPLNTRINLDANATFGITPAVFQRIKVLVEEQGLGNPSSVYRSGQLARGTLEEARLKIARLVGETDLRRIDVTFTSGATEANNWALSSPFLDGLACTGQAMVVLAVEHPAVTSCAAYWQTRGVEVQYAYPVGGSYSAERLLDLVNPETRVVSIMSANNETGHVYPVAELCGALKSKYPGLLVHTDAVQSLGKQELNFWSLGVDTIAISGHKIGALGGVGALISRKGLRLNPLILGGPQEVRRRAGTENLLGVYSFGVAAEEVSKSLTQRIQSMLGSRKIIEDVLTDSTLTEFISSGGLPNTISVRMKGVSAADLVVALDMRGVEVSYGSACASGKQDHSPVLTALGMLPEQAREVLRISVRGGEDPVVLRWAAQTILETAEQVRRAHG